MLSDEIMKKLLGIAKGSINYYFRMKDVPTVEEYGEHLATFVTLTKKGELRGCIGSIEPHQDLYKDVAVNAINAAFFDPRFPPLRESEREDLEIEVSVLTPKELFKGSNDEWIRFIEEKRPGVVIDYKGFRATFLPDVWKQIPSPFEFMTHLSLKAGLPPNAWTMADKYFYFTQTVSDKWENIEEAFFP